MDLDDARILNWLAKILPLTKIASTSYTIAKLIKLT